MSKHPLEYTCPDCKGSGVYQGLGAFENCQTCDGAGALIGVQLEIKKEDGDQLVDYIKKQYPNGIPGNMSTVDVQAVPKAGMSPSTAKLKVGDTVHVFDSGWYETVVDRFFMTSSGQKMVIVKYGTGSISGGMQMRMQSICLNLTKNRWEYIRSGTPVC